MQDITPNNSAKLYKYHVENLRELERAITQTARLAKAEIGRGDPQNCLRSLLRLYSFLLGAWAECRLKKLLHEQRGFEQFEREEILSKQTQLEQWKATVDGAFRKHHKIRKASLDSRVLGVSHAARREALHGVLDGELRIIIEIRNKLAHGQWKYPLNSDCSQVETDKFAQIKKENLLSLQFKYSLLGHLAEAVHDLVVSPTTFRRDFDDHFKKLDQVRKNLAIKDYIHYEQYLVSSRKRHRQMQAQRKSQT